MTVTVRIVFEGGPAEWMADEGSWRRSPANTREAGMYEDIKAAVPNIGEWESFWLSRASDQVELDARDLCFDGAPLRCIDWAFRGRRWISQRGRGPPKTRLPKYYSISPFEEGWVLYDEILERVMFLVATRTNRAS